MKSTNGLPIEIEDLSTDSFFVGTDLCLGLIQFFEGVFELKRIPRMSLRESWREDKLWFVVR